MYISFCHKATIEMVEKSRVGVIHIHIRHDLDAHTLSHTGVSFLHFGIRGIYIRVRTHAAHDSSVISKTQA